MFTLERVTGIEPALSAWEAEVLPLNYTRAPAHGRRPTPVARSAEQHTGWQAAQGSFARRPGYGGRVLLSDRDIRAQIESGRVALEPYEPEMIQPASIDVRLDRYFLLFDNHRYQVIDPAAEQPDLTHQVHVDGDDPLVLHPGQFVLGSTYEQVTLPADVSARLEGKSSLGRLGLLTHSTAGFIDPGFTGHVTLELSNVATLPILLWPGMKIGQLCFFQLSSPAQEPYGSTRSGSRYQGQRGPTASRSWQGFHRTQV